MADHTRRIQQNRTPPLTKQLLSIDSAILIASATILGYLVAYRYQMGQFDHYEINEVLFGQIYLNHIIIAMTAVLIFIIVILLIQMGLNWFYEQLPYFWSKLISSILPWFIFYLALGVLYNQVMFYYIPFFIAAYYLAVPFFYGSLKNYKQTFVEKMVKPYEDWNWRDYVPALVKEYKLEKHIIAIIFILVLLPQLAFFIAQYQAANQTDYLLFQYEDTVHIVLATTNDSLIVAPFNEDDLTFDREYIIVPYNGVADSLFAFEPVSLHAGIQPKNE